MGLSPTEIIVIVLIALLVFGPGRIAGVGRGLGEGIRSFKDGLRGLSSDDELPAPKADANDVTKAKPAPAPKPAAVEPAAASPAPAAPPGTMDADLKCG